MSPLDLSDAQALRAAYVDDGMSLSAIAAMAGCSYATVRRALLAHGIEIRRSGSPPIAELRDKEWLQRQVEDGASARDIAQDLGCAEATVRTALQWAGKGPAEARRRAPALDDRSFLEAVYVGDGRSVRSIAQEVGSTKDAVLQALRRHGIAIRRRGPAPAPEPELPVEPGAIALGPPPSAAVEPDAVLLALPPPPPSAVEPAPPPALDPDAVEEHDEGPPPEPPAERPPEPGLDPTPTPAEPEPEPAVDADAVEQDGEGPPPHPPAEARSARDLQPPPAPAPAPTPTPASVAAAAEEDPIILEAAEALGDAVAPPSRSRDRVPPAEREGSHVGMPAGSVPTAKVELEIDKLETKTFPLARRGYDRAEVDSFLRAIADDYRQVIRVAGEAVSAAQNAARQAEQKASASAPAPPTVQSFDEIGGQVASVLASAALAADEIRAAAEEEAQAIRQKAHDELGHMRQAAEDELAAAEQARATSEETARRLVSAARSEAATLLAGTREDADRILQEADEQAATLERTTRANMDAVIAEARRVYEHLRSVQQQCVDRLASVEFLAKHARDGLSETPSQALDELL